MADDNDVMLAAACIVAAAATQPCRVRDWMLRRPQFGKKN